MWQYYFLTLGIYGCLNGILALGFNLQFGQTGIINLAYFLFVAFGAYMTSIATVGPPPNDGVTHYLGGFGWPFPVSILFGVACTTIFALLIGGLAFWRLRHDYFALTLVAIGQGFLVLCTDDVHLFNGTVGVNGLVLPFGGNSPKTQQWIFLGLSVLLLAAVYALISRLVRSPLGRAMKTVREDEVAVSSLGKSPWRIKMIAFAVGAAAAGLAGGLFATFVGGWNVQAWQPGETLVLLAAVIVGGRGRNIGALIGSVVVLEGIVQASSFLPIFRNSQILPYLQNIVIGVLLLAFLWWRPQGLLPELKEKFAAQGAVPPSPEAHLTRTKARPGPA
jgi:branched-chain amino acid transport system permease protein